MSHSLPRKIDMVNPEDGVSLYLELPTIFLAALFGAAYFSTRGMSSLGSLGAGMAIGLGGGILRDVVLNIEPAAFSTWYFVPVASTGHSVAAEVAGGLVFVIVRMTGADRPRRSPPCCPFSSRLGVKKGNTEGICLRPRCVPTYVAEKPADVPFT